MVQIFDLVTSLGLILVTLSGTLHIRNLKYVCSSRIALHWGTHGLKTEKIFFLRRGGLLPCIRPFTRLHRVNKPLNNLRFITQQSAVGL